MMHLEHSLFVLPVTDPVFLFTVLLALILAVPLLAERLRLPGVVGLLLSGVLIGPHGLHIVARDRTMVLLGTIGLLYVMFIAGLEIDPVMFAKYRKRSLLFGFLSFLLPQAAGTAMGFWLGYSGAGAALMGAVLASHTLLAYPIASRLGLSRQPSVTMAVGGTIVTDLLALVVLAVVSGSSHDGGDLWQVGKLVAVIAAYVIAVLWVVPRVGRFLFRHLAGRHGSDFVFALTALFVVALAAKFLAIEAILGAFLAGLALNRFMPEHSLLMNRVQFVGENLFIPFFLLATGMLVDPRALLGGWRIWITAGAMLAGVVVGKWLAGWLMGWISPSARTNRASFSGSPCPMRP